MDFSIITPCFNSIRWIGQCIASVRGQVAPEAQKSDDLISDLRSPISESGASLRVHHHIQDGGSSDGTVEFLKEYVGKQPATGSYQLTFASAADKGMYNALAGALLALGFVALTRRSRLPGLALWGGLWRPSRRPVFEAVWSGCS